SQVCVAAPKPRMAMKNCAGVGLTIHTTVVSPQSVTPRRRSHRLPPRMSSLSARALAPLGLIWLSGLSLRVTILAVPPVLPMLRAELGLSGTEIGVLGSLPIVLFALAAVPGSLLVRWLGILATLVGGLAVVAVASALRGTGGSLTLFIASAVMGLGI